MNQRFLVLVDFQQDFVAENGALTINSPQLVSRVQQFADNLQKGMFEQIIVTRDSHLPETYALTPEADSFPPHCLYGTPGAELAVSLKDNIPVITLYKSTTDIWNELPNYKLLQQDWKGKEIYLAGVLSDICVRKAMNGFLRRGAKVTVFEDLTQGLAVQTPEIIAAPQYAGVVDKGYLRQITAAQFFRARLLEKKQQVNRLHSGREGK